MKYIVISHNTVNAECQTGCARGIHFVFVRCMVYLNVIAIYVSHISNHI